MRNYFTLDGVDSRDFGVYISGQGTFSAPGRDYNIIPVPGRNGDLVGPEQRFTNGNLTYSAFIYANFKQNISDFRNFLLSLFGYHDLIDSYHPDEIRKVFFEGNFEPTVTTKNDAGSFDITFNCKPQRYLASGQEVITFEVGAGETETYSGEVATFDNPGGAEITALSVAVEPVQAGSGDPSPDNVRPISGWDSVNIWNKPTHDTTTDPTVTIQLGQTVYSGTLDVTGGTMTVDRRYIVADGVNIRVSGGYGAGGPKWLPCIVLGSANKSVNDSSTIRASYLISNVNFQNAENSIGVGNGGLAIILHIGTMQGTDGTHGYNSASEVWNAVNAYLQEHPLQICYKLATPIEISLTPTQIATLVGQNNVWSDAGNVTAEVLTPVRTTVVTNPTRFNAKPLIRVYGTGILGIGSQSVTITQADEFTDIDCEMMDAFKGTASKNQYVQLTDYNFPVFAPGVNNISLGEGITRVDITPRWWKL